MNRIVKNPQDRREEIVRCARDLFLKNEYESTSVNDIVSALGIAKGTVYHYFKSKDELLTAVVEHIVEEYIDQLQAVLEQAEGSAIDRMRTLILSGNVSEEKGEMVEMLHSPGNVALHTRQLAVIFTKMAPLIAKVIEEGCKEGVFDVEYPLETAEILLAGIQFLTDVGVYPWTREDLQRRAKAIPALAEKQLNAPKGSFDFMPTS